MHEGDPKGLNALLAGHKMKNPLLISLERKTRKLGGRIRRLPWKEFLREQYPARLGFEHHAGFGPKSDDTGASRRAKTRCNRRIPFAPAHSARVIRVRYGSWQVCSFPNSLDTLRRSS